MKSKAEVCGDYIFYQAEPLALTLFQNPQKPRQLRFEEPLSTFSSVLGPANSPYLWLISETEICIANLSKPLNTIDSLNTKFVLSAASHFSKEKYLVLILITEQQLVKITYNLAKNKFHEPLALNLNQLPFDVRRCSEVECVSGLKDYKADLCYKFSSAHGDEMTWFCTFDGKMLVPYQFYESRAWHLSTCGIVV